MLALEKQIAQQAVERAEKPLAELDLVNDSDPIAWIEANFWIPETNAPIQLETYQKAVIREALRRDEHGAFVYSMVLYSDIKKSAKSTIAAAVCLYLAWHTPWESVRVVANDLKQADSRTFYYIERALRGNARLFEHCKIARYHIELLHNHTTIDAIPVDPKGEAGGGDLVTCFTELWAFKHEAARRLWSETTLSPLKFGKSLRWCESYAGFDGDSPILEQLYEAGVENGHTLDVGIDGLELYVNESARQLTLWNTQPRCAWQSPEYYAQEEAVLTPGEFARMHRNQWATSENVLVPIEWWDACEGSLPAQESGELWVIALDAATTDDCFAMVGVTRRGDHVYERYCQAWYPPKGGKLDFAGPEAELRRLCKTYKVAQVCYDPYQLHDMAMRLTNEGVAWFEEFGQGVDRLIADKQLYDTIRDGRMTHSGSPVLREHVQNANRKETGEQDKLRIVKRNEQGKIDAAVALSMASYRARYLLIG